METRGMSHVPGVFPRYFRKRVFEEMKAKGITMAEISRKTSIDNSFLKRMLDRKGTARLTEDYIDAICKVLDIRIAELPKEPIQVSVRYARKLNDPSLPQSRESDYLPVPIVEPRVAAGDPETISTEQVIDIAFIHRRALKRRSTENLICTFVRGDSMFPVIRDGAIVCIDQKARPEEGKVSKGSIWAVRKDGGAVVKHIQIGEGGIALISANPTYPPEVIEDGEAIIGRVVWMWQAL